jgi:hypothetical protein
MSRTLAITFVALCVSAPALARQTPSPVAPSRASAASSNDQRGTTPVPAAQSGTPAPPAKSADTGADLTDANITIEITVVDKAAGSSNITTRVGTITVANQSSGSVRGLSTSYMNAATKMDPVGLDVDARTWLRKSGMVSTSLTVAYIPAGAEPINSSIQRQTATLFLRPGQETQVLTTGSMSGTGPAVRITAKATVNK